MRRPREEVRRAKTNRLFMFLSGGRRGPGVEENNSGGGRQPPPLFRLFRGTKEHVDNIPTSLPRQMTPRRENEKQLERRFWKQLRRRRSESVISPSRVAT
uniref:Uncharacterized protein n=1 Tax=Timema shepardi TaxID=629360 RepID=A0A7R9B7S5_TIMSH|nr:unnamed protein product [Timema shepardi]